MPLKSADKDILPTILLEDALYNFRKASSLKTAFTPLISNRPLKENSQRVALTLQNIRRTFLEGSQKYIIEGRLKKVYLCSGCNFV